MDKENKLLSEKLQSIEDKVSKIESKMSEKWVTPVFLAVLTTILGIVSFLIQRNLNNGDISNKKENEVYGAFIAERKITLFNKCNTDIYEIDKRFDSLCHLNFSKEEVDSLDATIISLRKFIKIQQITDPKIVEKVLTYSDFIAEKTIEISDGKLSKQQKKEIYKESKIFHHDVTNSLNENIKLLQLK